MLFNVPVIGNCKLNLKLNVLKLCV